MSEPLDIYESCQTFLKTDQPDVLDHLLDIQFIEIATQRLLKRIRFFVAADESTARWIKAHPTFKRGCWPLGLHALHQWCWQIKFVEVADKKVVEGGIQDPNVGITTIRAEFESLDGGNWLVPLVNIANTHLKDQLRQFYADTPHAFPTAKRLTKVLKAEQAKARNKKAALKTQQRQRRAEISASNKAVRVFIDESGDIGFAETREVYAYASVIVPGEHYEALNADLRQILVQHWPGSPPKEIHLSKIQEPRRAAVINALATALLKHGVKAVCCVISKKAFLKHLFREHTEARSKEEMPLNVAWHDVTEDKDYYLQFNFLAATVEDVVADLAIDFIQKGVAAQFYHDCKHRSWMNDALQHGFTRGLETAQTRARDYFGLPLVPSATFAVLDSKAEPCLWLADWISNELNGWCHQKDFSEAFTKAKPNMTFTGFDPEGVRRQLTDLGGYGLEASPDRRREIHKGNPLGRGVADSQKADNGQTADLSD